MIYRAKQGVFARPETLGMIGKMPSYQFFLQFAACLPHLQWFAVRILAMVSGGASPERFYSKLSWIKDKRRNRLAHTTTQKLMWVNLNLAFQRKMRNLCYEETKVHHTLGESLDLDLDLLDFDVDVGLYGSDPMELLEEVEDELDVGANLWGIVNDEAARSHAASSNPTE